MEIGLPFSDPIADGPVIAKAQHVSLHNTKGDKKLILNLLSSLSNLKRVLIMSYSNPLLQWQAREYLLLKRRGLKGFLVPDLPLECGLPFYKKLHAFGFSTVQFLAPDTPPSRVPLLAKYSSPFLYYVQVRGITGTRKHLNEELAQRLESFRQKTRVPIYVGFGISRPEHVRELKSHAEGAIVGSALISEYNKKGEKALKSFFLSLKSEA